jgi:hypothetical protein
MDAEETFAVEMIRTICLLPPPGKGRVGVGVERQSRAASCMRPTWMAMTEEHKGTIECHPRENGDPEVLEQPGFPPARERQSST